jgi:hypothetical protein
MNISLTHFLKISGSEAELLAGLDGLNLASTYMSNERWRDRQILHLFLGGVFARPLQETKRTIMVRGRRASLERKLP